MDSRSEKIFRRLGIITIVSVYLLILVGGVVRSTGSGMGCPDWPRCFGSWVPPTSAEQLPSNYKEIYSQKRMAKNEKIASYLKASGFVELSEKITKDKAIAQELDFNVTKTWIEYLNRLVGVVIGFLIFLVLLYSIPYLKSDKIIFWLSLSSFILVGIEGWLGSIVVSTNLLPFTVTLHMALALFLVCLLIYVVVRSQKQNINLQGLVNRKSIQGLLIVLLLITFFQILTGTQVREEVDIVSASMNYLGRSEWISRLGNVFLVHRSFTILILLAHLYLLYLLRNNFYKGIVFVSSVALFALLIAEIIFGISMSYFSIPAFIQPLHLLFGTLIFGLQFFILIFLNFSNDLKNYKIRTVEA